MHGVSILRFRRIPEPCHFLQRTFVIVPIVQSRRIEIGPIGPEQRVRFVIQRNLPEELGVCKWTKKLTLQHRLEVYRLLCAIIKADL